MRVLSVPVVDSFPTVVCLPVTQIDPKTDQIPGFETRKDYEESWYMPSIAKAIRRYREEEEETTKNENKVRNDDNGDDYEKGSDFTIMSESSNVVKDE